jgi:transposase
MDNLPTHKLTSIVPMIEAVGARVICLSPYSPDFNPIEMWWSQLKSFLRSFAPKSPAMIDRIIAVALDLMNPSHLKIWSLIVVTVPHSIGKSCNSNTSSPNLCYSI